MFYRIKIKDHIRVPPRMFNLTKKEAVLANIRLSYDNYISKELGFVLNVVRRFRFTILRPARWTCRSCCLTIPMFFHHKTTSGWKVAEPGWRSIRSWPTFNIRVLKTKKSLSERFGRPSKNRLGQKSLQARKEQI